MQRHQFLNVVAVTAFVSATGIFGLLETTSAQSSRNIRLVVPFAAGGSIDVQARLLAEQISRSRNLTVVVENRPGGGTIIGTESVARANPDGSTLLLVGYSFLINPNLRRLNYDPLTSFEPVCYLTRSSLGVIVNSNSSHRSLADFLGAARERPGTETLATAGAATAPHLTFEMLKLAAKVNITHVPYAGAAPAVNALLGNHVSAMLIDYPSVMEHINSGKLRSLATASRTREQSLPQIPTVEESGYKDFDADNMVGLVAPTRTPKAVVSEIASWFRDALKNPEITSKLAVLGLSAVGTCEGEFGMHLRKKNDEYRTVIKEANIKPE